MTTYHLSIVRVIAMQQPRARISMLAMFAREHFAFQSGHRRSVSFDLREERRNIKNETMIVSTIYMLVERHRVTCVDR